MINGKSNLHSSIKHEKLYKFVVSRIQVKILKLKSVSREFLKFMKNVRKFSMYSARSGQISAKFINKVIFKI
jgi:hypothetical protein